VVGCLRELFNWVRPAQASILPQQVGELSKVHRNPPCLIFGEEFRRACALGRIFSLAFSPLFAFGRSSTMRRSLRCVTFHGKTEGLELRSPPRGKSWIGSSDAHVPLHPGAKYAYACRGNPDARRRYA